MSDRGLNGKSNQDGEHEISWKAPVTAAVIGALLVSVFVVYAIVAGPVDEPDSGAIQSTELPPGFTALPSGTGIKIEFVTETEKETLVGVSSAVPGTADPAQTSPEEIAYWEMTTDAGIVGMDRQLGTDTAAGNTTVAFPNGMASGEQRFIAYPVTDSTVQTTTLEDSARSPDGTVKFAVKVSEEVTVAGEVAVGNDWGLVDWYVEGDTTAKVDVVVTFAGVDDPSTEAIEIVRLVPDHLRDVSGASDPESVAPLFAHQGQYRLYRSGDSVDAPLIQTKVAIEITSTVATAVGEAVVVKFPADA